MKRGAMARRFPLAFEAECSTPTTLRLQLTTDTRLQQVPTRRLTASQESGKRSESRHVMDVRNGEMLALASAPTVHPNRFLDFSTRPVREWSVQDLYETGHVSKADQPGDRSQEKAVKPSDRFNDSGSLMIGGGRSINHAGRANGRH